MSNRIIWTVLSLLALALPARVAGQKAVKQLVSNADTGEDAATILEKGGDQVKEFLIRTQDVFWSLLIILATWLLLRILKKLLNFWAESSTKYRLGIKGFIPLLAFLLWAMATYVIVVKVVSPPQETLWAGLASLGIAFGFAAQDILKNVFAGVIILFDAPFRMGDKIEVGQHYGEVLQIGLRSTKLVTPDDSLVTVPNSELMNTAVSNSNSGEPNCQVVAEFYLPHGIDTDRVRQIAIEAAQVSKHVFLNKPITVLFFHHVHEREVLLKMRLKAYVLDIRAEFAFKSDMTELVMDELMAEGIIAPHQSNQRYGKNSY